VLTWCLAAVATVGRGVAGRVAVALVGVGYLLTRGSALVVDMVVEDAACE
jgi:hypothetical protein